MADEPAPPASPADDTVIPGVPAHVRTAMKDPSRRLGARGRYVLSDMLQEGAAGSVWRGWDLELCRWVAIKRLRETCDDESLENFKKEAQIPAAVRHPNVAAVFEAGAQEGHPYFVRQYIGGVRLTERLGKCEPLDAAEIVLQPAFAIDYVHRRGVLHRNINPGTLMIDTAGRTYVTSFG